MAKAKKVVFKTKDGKEVSFKKKVGAAAVKKVKAWDAFERRLAAMEKAVSGYNAAAKAHNEKREAEKKGKVGNVVKGAKATNKSMD